MRTHTVPDYAYGVSATVLWLKGPQALTNCSCMAVCLANTESHDTSIFQLARDEN